MAWVNAEMITTAVISESEDPPNISGQPTVKVLSS